MQIKASVSELNRDMQNNEMWSLGNFGNVEANLYLNSYFDNQASNANN